MTPIIALLIFSLLMYFTPSTNVLPRVVRIISGAIALIFIPGFYIVKIFFEDYLGMEKFGFSLIFGLAFQGLVVLSLYSVGSLFLYNEIDFSLTILILTFIFTALLFISQFRIKQRSKKLVDVISLGGRAKAFVIDNKFLIAVFALSLVARLYYQSFVEAPITDGALYMEMAKNLEATGQFTSKVIKDSWATQYYNELGLSHHPFTYFFISVFFSMGGAYFSSAKLMTVFAGCLIVFMIYKICKELFGEETAMIAAIVASIHPMCLLFSSVIYGSEVLGTLFMLTAFYFFLTSLRAHDLSSSRRYAILAGLFAALTLGTTNYNYWAFWFGALIPFVLTLSKEGIRMRAKIMKFMGAFFLVVGIIVATFLTPDQYFLHPLSSNFWVIYSAFPVAFVIILLWRRNDKCTSSLYLMGIVAFAIYQFLMIRTYYLAQIIPRESVAPIISPLPDVSLPLAILGIAYLQLTNFLAFSSFYNISWEIMMTTSTQIIIFLAAFSFIRVSKWKENLYVISFPFFLSFIMTLFGFVPTTITFWGYRLYVAATPFFIVLSASTLGLLSKVVPSIEVPTRKSVFRMKGIVFATPLVIIILFTSFLPLYGEWIAPMQGKYERILYWEPAFDWIKTNTPEDAIIMARKPREFAWYTNRATVCPLGSSRQGAFTIREKTLVDLILQFGVDYVVVDNVFYADYPYLTDLYNDPSEAPYGFTQVFNHEDDRGKLLIYDVMSVTSPIQVIYLRPSEDAYTYGNIPDANIGDFTWLYVGKGSKLDPLDTFLKFDLSPIPRPAEIVQAKLKLITRNVILKGVGGSSADLKIFVNYVADDSWNEQNVTYGNQPAFHPEIFNASQSKETYGPRESITWNITELVKKEHNEDSVLSVVVEMDYLTFESTRVEFFSKESQYEPVLEIEYS